MLREKASRTERPWGRFETYMENGNNITVKVITIASGQRLSLQLHLHRRETWVCLQGPAYAEINGRTQVLQEGEMIGVPLGAKHRLGAGPGCKVQVLEIAQGLFNESDVVRLEDDYGRAVNDL
ncbi:MAG: phosphomannose isomerase type II C-terminal cupin domain [Nitrososphaerales archaeon]|jgi:mannose-1-phosphate guanylyltransferase/mannose-6-phosphate isomerase